MYNLISHTSRKVKTILTLIVFLTTAIACDDEENKQSNIVQLAQGNANLSTLVTALSKFPDLVTTLSGNGNFTVFAPTNAAFNQLLEDLEATSLNDVDDDDLREILEYHVITTAALKAADLASQGYTTAEGKQLFVSVGSSVKINGVVTVTTANLAASNGVVHVVDKVIVPPTQTIAQIATAFNPNEFTQLVAALARTSGRNPDLLAAVSNPGTLTVFAPTDAAFQQLYTALQVQNVNQIDINVLTSVLRHHVITSRKYSSDLTTGTLGTLNGDNVTINVANLTVTGASGGTNVANLQPTLLNINGTNGVIHVINRVLLPDLD
jgi:transforming growth factor-beta-induced protein